jgi:hypothetical protein
LMPSLVKRLTRARRELLCGRRGRGHDFVAGYYGVCGTADHAKGLMEAYCFCSNCNKKVVCKVADTARRPVERHG